MRELTLSVRAKGRVAYDVCRGHLVALAFGVDTRALEAAVGVVQVWEVCGEGG